MLDISPFQPTQQDWQQIESLHDLPAMTGGSSADLQHMLGQILEWLGQPRAALYVRSWLNGEIGFWIHQNLPTHWQNQIEDPYSQLQLIARQILDSGDSFPENTYGDVAGAFPVRAGTEVVGALILQGQPIPPHEYPRWAAYLRPLGRAILNRPSMRSQDVHRAVVSALLSISAVQSSENDINTLQRAVLQGLREIFESEDALLILLDDDNPRMAIKKQLGMGDNWVERSSLDIENTPVHRAIKELRCIQEDLVASQNYLSWLNSTAGVKVHSILCAPLVTNRCVIGAVVLLNPELDCSAAFRNSLLAQLTATLANAIYTSRQMLNLKISIADLEASRWEIVNSRNTLRTLFDSIPSSVYIIDRSYTIISINIRRSNRAGRRPSSLVGKKCYDLLYARTDPCPSCRVMETFNNGSINTRFNREWLEHERFVEWEITIFPIQEKSNLPHQAIIFEEDVTDKRNLEANLIQSEKLAAVGQLAAGVAHEINNPLAAIIANAQMLKRELAHGDPDTLDSIKLIETAGIRASQVVSNLLGIARKEKHYEFEMLSLNDTILSALSLVHHEVINHSIDIKLDLADDLPEIIASKNQIQGVWINMIVNSIDAIENQHGQISITTRYVDREFRVTFADNGKGIPEDQLTRIFEPFYTTKVAGKGTGLGLSVCLRVIKEHQGSVNVESLPGKGTRFIIILPDLNRS